MNKQELFEVARLKERDLINELDYLTNDLATTICSIADLRNSFDFEDYNIDININDLKDRIETLEFQVRDTKRAIDRYEDARDEYNRASNIANGDYSHAADREV